MSRGAEVIANANAVYSMLEQDRVWGDVHGVLHNIDEMDEGYRLNVLRWLRRRARMLAFYHGLGACRIPGPTADGANHEWDRALDELWQFQMNDPEAWLDTTPLVRKFIALGEAGVGGINFSGAL